MPPLPPIFLSQAQQDRGREVYNSEPFAPPPQQRGNGALHSLTAGGYGPVSPSSTFDNGTLDGADYAKDAKGRKLHNRVYASVTSCLRECGCSGHEMKMDEGKLMADATCSVVCVHNSVIRGNSRQRIYSPPLVAPYLTQSA